MSRSRVLMIVGDFVEDYEAMVPFQTLQAVGHEVHAVCPRREAGAVCKTAIHDFEGDQTYTEKPGHGFELTHSFDGVSPESYDALVLPGGRAPEYLRTYDDVLETVSHFFTTEKPVAALCHGIQILVAADVLDGYTCTAYPALQADVAAAGATWSDAVVQDGHLVTGQAWPDHPEWLRVFLDLLGTEIEHGQTAVAGD